MAKIDRADKVRDLPERQAAPERAAAFQTGLSAKGRAAALLMAAGFELRFDAILIAPRRLPRHLLAAFDAST